MIQAENAADAGAECKEIIASCRAEMAKRLIGQTEITDGILTAMIAGGHLLLEGVPGLAKTLAVRTFAEISSLDFKRVQFTPDLLPADITGTLIYNQVSGTFSVRKGPVFANLLLADEINRAPAKVQSALLEAMAEHQVTIGDESFPLPDPFFVLATQNPIEQEGTYSLPEAELDRFLLKVLVPYPSAQEEAAIVKSGAQVPDIPINAVFSAEKLNMCRAQLGRISMQDEIVNYIVSLVTVTRPENTSGTRQSGGIRADFLRYISFGASPRAGIALAVCAKVRALFDGRSFVLPDDVKKAAPSVLRHRLVLSYEAAADNASADAVIEKILELMPVP
ncbi:MAG: AAA family ATPase [Bacteroides sp.]|nr:AAA family ATPase [Prevotella sp.]MCM1408524.1 AAA family ATPase [Treponema brennaborense]MCM1470762.1 AAA family ATPase [Bacteroides sp.]